MSNHRTKPALLIGASLLTAVLAGGCTKGAQAPDAGAAKGWQVFTTPGENYTYVIPTTLEDGTRCVVVAGNAGYSGRGVTCDWRK